MRSTRCSRERDVLLAAAHGWTRAADAELAVHVASCSACLEITSAAEALRARCASEIASARPPSPALVWWRLERRLLEDRARAASRPLTVVHGIAGTVGVAVTLSILQFARPWLGLATRGLAASVIEAWSTLADRSAAAPQLALPFLLMAITVLVLAPTALYLGVAKDE